MRAANDSAANSHPHGEPTSTDGSAICFFGTYERKRVARISVLLEGLRAHGHMVYECNAPLGLTHEEKLKLLKKPWRVLSLVSHLSRSWTRLWQSSKSLPPPDFVLVPYMGHFDILLAKLRFRSTPIMLDHMIFAADTARDRRAPSFIASLFHLLDWVALTLADVIILDTPEHQALVPSRLRHRSVVVPIGVPKAWLLPESSIPIAAKDPAILRIIFFGLFTPLQGIETIAKSFLRLKECNTPFSVTMVGHGQDYQLARQLLGSLGGIDWIDWLDEADLIAAVKRHQVCLGIFGASQKSKRVVPQKLFLGAAAGCVVVTSDTLPQRRVFSEIAHYVPSEDANALAETLAALAHDLKALEQQRVATRAYAKEFFSPVSATSTLNQKIKSMRTTA